MPCGFGSRKRHVIDVAALNDNGAVSIYGAISVLLSYAGHFRCYEVESLVPADALPFIFASELTIESLSPGCQFFLFMGYFSRSGSKCHRDGIYLADRPFAEASRDCPRGCRRF